MAIIGPNTKFTAFFVCFSRFFNTSHSRQAPPITKGWHSGTQALRLHANKAKSESASDSISLEKKIGHHHDHWITLPQREYCLVSAKYLLLTGHLQIPTKPLQHLQKPNSGSFLLICSTVHLSPYLWNQNFKLPCSTWVTGLWSLM